MSEGVYQNNIYLKIVAPLLIVGMCPIVRIGKLLRTQKRMCVSMSGCAENASVVASYGLPDMYKKRDRTNLWSISIDLTLKMNITRPLKSRDRKSRTRNERPRNGRDFYLSVER